MLRLTRKQCETSSVVSASTMIIWAIQRHFKEQKCFAWFILYLLPPLESDVVIHEHHKSPVFLMSKTNSKMWGYAAKPKTRYAQLCPVRNKCVVMLPCIASSYKCLERIDLELCSSKQTAVSLNKAKQKWINNSPCKHMLTSERSQRCASTWN